MNQSNPFIVPPPAASPRMPVRPSTFGPRALALVLDHVAIFVCLFPGFVCLLFFSSVANSYPAPPDTLPAETFGEVFAETLPVFLGGLLAGLLVQAYFLASQARSLGKRWMGLRIVRRDGRRAGALRVLFVRTPVQLLNYLPVAGQILTVVNLSLALRPGGHSLHDRVADTEVVVD